jgi:transposase
MNYAELIVESEAALSELENKQKLVQFQKRLRFLRLLKNGAAKTQVKAGQMVGWKLRQSQKIWQLYRVGGVSSVLQKNARWQTGKLSVEQRGKLSEQLAAAGGAASLAAVRNHIETTFGVCYTIGGVSGLCQRLKIKLKTARPRNILKDEARALEYKKTLAS